MKRSHLPQNNGRNTTISTSYCLIHCLFVTLKMNYQVNCSLFSNDIITSDQCCLPTGCQMTRFTCTTMHCFKFHFKVWAFMFWELFQKLYIFGGWSTLVKRPNPCHTWTSIYTECWSNLVIFTMMLRGSSKPTETARRGKVVYWRRARWGNGELDSRGSINHSSCCLVLTLQSHWATTVNALSDILHGSMRKRAWLNTHLWNWCVHMCLCRVLQVFLWSVSFSCYTCKYILNNIAM